MSQPLWTWTQIKTMAAADAFIQAITDGTVWIALAEAEMDKSIWADRYNLGRAYAALHFASVSQGASAIKAGPVVSETLEGISRTRQAKTDSISVSPFDATEYGRQFQYYARIVGRRSTRF